MSGSGNANPQHFVAVGNTLYFDVVDGTNGLWKSDGTANGTVLVKDVNAGGIGHNDGRYKSGCVELVGNTLYFTATDGINGGELWALDPANITFGELLKYTFDFKLQVLEQLYPIFPSEDSADLAIDEPMVNITFQYDLKSAGTMVNQNIALSHRATCAIVENLSLIHI